MNVSEAELTAYLERKGLLPAYGPRKVKFRHPQRLSRTATLTPGGDGCTVAFTHPQDAFAKRWKLASPGGELPANLDGEQVRLALDDFFRLVLKNPPAGSPPFEERLKEVQEILHRYASRHQRSNHYELGYEDLLAVAREKAFEVYLEFGNKPVFEFQCLVATSVERRFYSLQSKHFKSHCRAGAQVVALSDEMNELIAADAAELANPNDWKDYLDGLDIVERDLIQAVICPPPVLQRENQLETLRFRHVKRQKPKVRVPEPRYRLPKIALVTDHPVPDLCRAFTHLAQTTPHSAWGELIDPAAP